MEDLFLRIIASYNLIRFHGNQTLPETNERLECDKNDDEEEEEEEVEDEDERRRRRRRLRRITESRGRAIS